MLRFDGASGVTRTPDLLITNQLLYRLSYTSAHNCPNRLPFQTKESIAYFPRTVNTYFHHNLCPITPPRNDYKSYF